ncbi:MAG: glycosyltransferase family A protein [Bacteroidota bacterium]
MKKHKISFCTTCMNRLTHIKETFKKNILDNADYDNVEFLLLDYNSSDGLQDYVKTELGEFILTKKLSYFRTEDPIRYNMSHSRNLAFKLANGEILCNVDSDNFTGPGFATYINEMFVKNDKIYLSTHGDSSIKNDVLGRICVKKDDFLNVNGYDESMLHYGFDDFDFSNRLQMNGLSKKTISDQKFLNAISHSNAVRIQNFEIARLEKLLINHITPAESILLFLFADGKFKQGTIISNYNYNALSNTVGGKKNLTFRYSLSEDGWIEGIWGEKDNMILLTVNKKELSLTQAGDNWLIYNNSIKYRDSQSTVLKDEMLFFLHQISNRMIMEKNLSGRIIKVNEGKFGLGTVSTKLN